MDPRLSDDRWIQTFTGKQFWPLSPEPDDIDIKDIAHALSLMCRYGGHTKQFYSVAQHSVLVARECERLCALAGSPNFALTALLHDAAEAYMADVLRPIKKSISQIAEIEEKLEMAVAQRFNLAYPFPAIVKECDNILLNTERRDLMATPPRPWNTYGVGELEEKIVPWTCEESERRFLEAYNLAVTGYSAISDCATIQDRQTLTDLWTGIHTPAEISAWKYMNFGGCPYDDPRDAGTGLIMMAKQIEQERLLAVQDQLRSMDPAVWKHSMGGAS